MAEKVKVRVYSDEKHFKLIEVDENEVDLIKHANRLLWRDIDKEKRQKKILQESGIKLCSLESCQEDFEYIENEALFDPEIDLIMNEERIEQYKWVHEALKILNNYQQEIIRLRFIEDMSLNGIAEKLNVSIGTIQVHLKRSLKKMKKFIEKCLKTCQKNSFISEGVEEGGAER